MKAKKGPAKTMKGQNVCDLSTRGIEQDTLMQSRSVKSKQGESMVFAKYRSSHGAPHAPFLSQQELSRKKQHSHLQRHGRRRTPKNSRPRRAYCSKKEQRQRMNNGYRIMATVPMREDEMQLLRHEEGMRESVMMQLLSFVLLNPYSATVYCQRSWFSFQGSKSVELERDKEKSSKINGETTNHFSVYCKTYHKLSSLQAHAREMEAQVLF